MKSAPGAPRSSGAPSSKPPLALDGVTKRFRELEAVRDVSFRVDPGEVVGLLGPNGAGKTTTLSLCLGLMHPTRGKIRLFGRNPCSPRAHVDGVGALFDAPAFHDRLTARENLRYLGLVRGVDRAGIDPALETAGLASAGDRPVKTFSFGMRKRLGLAAAMLAGPRLLILDEPTAGMDPQGARDVRELLRTLADRGTAILVSTHLLAEAERIAARTLIFRAGRLVAEAGPGSFGGPRTLRLRGPDPDRLEVLIATHEPAGRIRREGDAILVEDPEHDPATLNRLCANEGLWLDEIRWIERSLEAAFLEITGEGDSR